MMGILIGVIIFILIALAAAMVYKGYIARHKNKSLGVIGAISIPVLLVMFIFIPFGFKQVNAGEIAVVKVWGDAVDTKTEGLHFMFVLSTKYAIYDLKAQEINRPLEAYSQDGQSMSAELTVQFRVKADKVLDIAKTFGDVKILTDRIDAIAIERTKVVLSSESAMALIENRTTLSAKVEESIKNSVGQYHVDITMVALTDITFSAAFERTVEEKMMAEQQKLQAKYEAEKAVIEAQRDRDVAILQAEAAIEKAKGEAGAIEEIAKAQAAAMRTKMLELALAFGAVTEIDVDGEIFYEIDTNALTAQQSEIIVDYFKYITYLENWDGKLPSVVAGDDISMIIPKP